MSRANPRFHRTNAPLPLIGTQPVCQISILGVNEGDNTVNTFSYVGPSGITPTVALLGTLLTNFQTALHVKWLALLSFNWTCQKYQCVSQIPNTLTTVSDVVHAGAAGTGGAGSLPTTVAATMIRQTGVKGQHGRGRLSVPAIPIGAATLSQLTLAGWLASSLAFRNAAILAVSDGVNSWIPSIVQRSTSSPHQPLGSAPIIAYTQTLTLGSDRRRKTGR